MMKFRHKFIMICFLLGSVNTSVEAQPIPEQKLTSITLDSSVRHGQLQNGLQYFIKPTSGDPSKLYLQLHHKVGYQNEDDFQLEAAHSIEHLTFKPSQNFPAGIVNDDRIKSFNLGMYDFSGTTGTRGTTYSFSLNDNSEALELAFLWFKDIIGGLELSEENMDQVRGEISQEIILKVGNKINDFITESRFHALVFPCTNTYTGFFEHNRNFKPEMLREFYAEWSRPDLMAISIVGSIEDVDQMEKNIQEQFKNIPSSEQPQKVRYCDSLYYSRPPQFHTLERPQDTLMLLQSKEEITHLIFRDPMTRGSLSTMKGHERLFLLESLTSIINRRFREINTDFKPITVLSRSHKRAGRPPSLEIGIQSHIGMAKKAIKETSNLLQQLRTFGVTEKELERTKDVGLRHLNNIDTSEVRFWSKEIGRYFIYDEALPDQKHAHLRQWLSDLTVKEFNSFITDFLSKIPEDIGIIAPPGSRALTLTEGAVRSWLDYKENEKVKPYQTPEIPVSLMDADEVLQLRKVEYKEMGSGPSGAREVMLKNGVKVVFKSTEPTAGASSAVNIHGFSLIGANDFPDKHFYSALNSPAIVKNSGVNGIDRFTLDRFLSSVPGIGPGGANVYITNEESGVHGSSSIHDFEILLQLIYLTLTNPNKDKKAFKSWKNLEYKEFRNPPYSIVKVDFEDAIAETVGDPVGSSVRGNHLRGTARYTGVQQTSLNPALKIFKEIFGSSGDFTFIIRGAFEIDTILPLVQKYLGNLPNSSSTIKPNPKNKATTILSAGPHFIKIPPPNFYRMKNMSYGIKFIHKAQDPSDWKEEIRVKALGAIIHKKAWGLRWEKGYSIYNIGAAGTYNKNQHRYEISSTFQCIEEEFEEIRKDFKQLITEIKTGKITEEEFSQGLELLLEMNSVKMANHPRVLDEKLYNHYRHGQPWVSSEKIELFTQSLTIQDISEAANKYLKDENLYEFYMKPN